MCGNSLLEELIVGDESIKLFDERLLNLKELKSSPPQDARQEALKKQLQEKQKELRDLYDANKLSMAKKKELDSQILAINKELNLKAKKTKSEVYHPVLFADQADEYFKRLRELHKQFFTEYDPVKKKERRKQIEDIELEFIKSSIKEKVDELNLKIKNLNMQDPGDRKKQAVLMKKKLEYLAIPEQIRNSKTRPYFLWKLNFFEVFQEKGGFDVVIANPPYIKEYVNKNAFDGLRSLPYYQGKMDIWYFFACKGLDLLKTKFGTLTFIAQNNWVTSYGASKMRNKVIKDTQILNLIDFGDFKIFESADIQTMVMIFETNAVADGYSFDFRRLRGGGVNFQDVLDLLNYNQNYKCEYLIPTVRRAEFIDKSLTFSNTVIELILTKLFQQSNFKLTSEEVANGIHHHHDKVNKERQEILGNKFKIRDGIFVLSEKEKKAIPFSDKELQLIKPAHTTRELFKWYGKRKNTEWVIYTDSRFKEPKNIKPYQISGSDDVTCDGIVDIDDAIAVLRKVVNENFILDSLCVD